MDRGTTADVAVVPLCSSGQRLASTLPSSLSSSRLSAHSNIERVAGFGFPFLLAGFGGSSAMNSAQENIDCWVSSTTSA